MSSRWVTRLIAATTMAWAGVVDARPRRSAGSGRENQFQHRLGFVPAGTVDEWSTASLNYPLTIGDHVWTDSGARTELQLDTAVLRVAPATELSVLNLDDHVAQVRLTQGTCLGESSRGRCRTTRWKSILRRAQCRFSSPDSIDSM